MNESSGVGNEFLYCCMLCGESYGCKDDLKRHEELVHQRQNCDNETADETGMDTTSFFYSHEANFSLFGQSHFGADLRNHKGFLPEQPMQTTLNMFYYLSHFLLEYTPLLWDSRALIGLLARTLFCNCHFSHCLRSMYHIMIS